MNTKGINFQPPKEGQFSTAVDSRTLAERHWSFGAGLSGNGGGYENSFHRNRFPQGGVYTNL